MACACVRSRYASTLCTLSNLPAYPTFPPPPPPLTIAPLIALYPTPPTPTPQDGFAKCNESVLSLGEVNGFYLCSALKQRNTLGEAT